MNNAEKFNKIVEKKKASLKNYIRYFFILRELKNDAQSSYTGTNYYKKLNPWIINKLKDDGFIVLENQKDSQGQEYTSIVWTIEEEDEKS